MSDPEAPDGASSGSGDEISEDPEVQRLRKELEDAERAARERAAQRDDDTPSSTPSTDPADVPESRRFGFGGMDKRQGIALVVLVAVITATVVFTSMREDPAEPDIKSVPQLSFPERAALRNHCDALIRYTRDKEGGMLQVFGAFDVPKCKELVGAVTYCSYNVVRNMIKVGLYNDPEWPVIVAYRCNP
jgi:hypothetical protein